MSGQLMGLVYNLDITRSQREVLLALAEHAKDPAKDPTGVGWPSLDVIAWKTRISKRQVRRIIRQIEQLGIMSVKCAGGRHITSRYKLNLELLFGREKPELQKPPRQRCFQKEDIVSPFSEPENSPDRKGDIPDRKGDILDQERVTFQPRKGDTAMSPEPLVLTVIEPEKEPEVFLDTHTPLEGGRGVLSGDGGLGEGETSLRSANSQFPQFPKIEFPETESLVAELFPPGGKHGEGKQERQQQGGSVQTEGGHDRGVGGPEAECVSEEVEVLHDEAERRKEKVETCKRRFQQFHHKPNLLKIAVDAELGDDEQARAEFEEWRVKRKAGTA